MAFNKKPFYVVFKPPKKAKKGEKQQKGVNAEIYQDEERVFMFMK